MITIDSPRGDQPIQVPRQAEGSAYRFEMIHAAAARRTYADTLTELLNALIPGGYADADDAMADQLRLRHAVDTQVQLQTDLIAAGDLEACDAEQLEMLLGARTRPPEPPGIWTAPIPLVLIDTYYRPLGPRPRPTGNLVWLSPRDETSYLESLHAAGVIVLSELNPAATASNGA